MVKMNMITYNSLCSNGTNIWGIDTKGAIYEISASDKTVRLVHWIDEVDDADGNKFPIMCHADGKLVIAPANGQKFWKYDPVSREIISLTIASEESFPNFYEWKDKIYFIGRECKNIAIYERKTGNFAVEAMNLGRGYPLAQAETRGGCRLDDNENRVVFFVYGSEIIYEFSLGERIKKENEIDMRKPVAFAHKIDRNIVIVTTEGKFYLSNEEGLSEIKMPDGYKCSNAPFHYWTRSNHGLCFMPCGMNMILYYANGKVEKICDSSTWVSTYGQMGIFPCCAYGESKVIGFSRYENSIMEINVKDKSTSRIKLQSDADNEAVNKLIEAKTKNSIIIKENDYGISLDSFIHAVASQLKKKSKQEAL